MNTIITYSSLLANLVVVGLIVIVVCSAVMFFTRDKLSRTNRWIMSGVSVLLVALSIIGTFIVTNNTNDQQLDDALRENDLILSAEQRMTLEDELSVQLEDELVALIPLNGNGTRYELIVQPAEPITPEPLTVDEALEGSNP
jgi:hypothetical protein